ncbi:MAG: hypothetical protein A3F73_00610 [Gallionellales bacterium RIFCSPLOWO2_12_FULL_59_22]|nr:MAG: hypothetical protein A3H99_04310 [Gallionellales bacterium RIFCSPLOWO2_02_FULL_59_110]OGT01573.1 MAG: hypothetical protein A2Z65_01020 [Gallionellales bacterium RIFCSPLOWO2_02_58_13]OGT12499.1 MAG: hypothetical protein A3F73_00610 [Gallionellales bacterium RIFCSPLOWO2_12_FULL_59_22]
MIRNTGNTSKNSIATLLSMTCLLLLAGNAQAHCDTTGGPIIPEARIALKNGDITPVLKWVKQNDEAEIRAAFARAVAVRGKGKEAMELADRYFLETLVRVHRAGEGAPYSGIKDEAVDPIVALADKALANGSADEMIGMIGNHMAAAIRAKFQHALKTGKNKDKSVDAGREFVEAYVTYMHYVEGVHTAIASSADHHHAAPAATPAPAADARDHHNH